jgi:hypothetical protein
VSPVRSIVTPLENGDETSSHPSQLDRESSPHLNHSPPHRIQWGNEREYGYFTQRFSR